MSNALAVLAQTLMDLHGVADGLSCFSQARQPAPVEAEMAVLRNALEQLWILARGPND